MKKDAFVLSRKNRKARKAFKMLSANPSIRNITKTRLFMCDADAAWMANGCRYPNWTRRELRFIRYMAVPANY